MASRRSTKSDLLSGLGAVFEFVRIMRALEVTDEDFRSAMSDKAHAAQVANAMRRNHPEAAAFADLVNVGRFNSVSELFDSKFNDRWTNKGDRVRGSFHLLRMSGTYREGDLAAALSVEGRRIGKTLVLATAYELAFYGSNGWNGTDDVVEWASTCVDRDDNVVVSYLWCDGAYRRLSLLLADDAWYPRSLVLCVCE